MILWWGCQKKKCIFLVFYFTLWRLQTGSWKLFVLKISAGQGMFLALCIFWFTYILFCLRGEHVGNCSVVNKILRQKISKNLIFETFQRKISPIKSLKCKMLFYFTFFFIDWAIFCVLVYKLLRSSSKRSGAGVKMVQSCTTSDEDCHLASNESEKVFWKSNFFT